MSEIDVSFSFFCSFLHEISQAPSHKPAPLHKFNNPDYPALNILRRWNQQLMKDYSPLPLGTTAIIFKLLFPNEDHRRKFDMQEMRLAESLADCFGFDVNKLRNWSSENSSGCLGLELRHVLETTSPTIGNCIGPLSILQVDELLDELASTSEFTDLSIRKKYRMKRRTRLSIIKDLFRTLSPIEAGFLAQIVLKDLRPILYPLAETCTVKALLDNNQASTKMLSRDDTMKVWDPTRRMSDAHRIHPDLSKAAECLEMSSRGDHVHVPQIGSPIQVTAIITYPSTLILRAAQIPRSEKGRSLRHALHFFNSSRKVWAETKYDGERAQIHIELREDGPNLRIFSKSKRDSTWDRRAVHDCIYRALGLSGYEDGRVCGIRKNAVLDAEMVAFHGEKIDEFWRINGLIERTATGARGSTPIGASELESSSTVTDLSDGRRLGLVFFDVLVFDSKSHLLTPYWRRRGILENLIRVVPGECILSERLLVGTSANDSEEMRLSTLDKIFSSRVAMYEEGIVLKGHDSTYHDSSMPWVKLKKDYIPGYGDTIDLVIIAVGWEKERGRELRVSPSTFTTFYIGGLEEKEPNEQKATSILICVYAFSLHRSSHPHFHVYFKVSYGQSRLQLEQANFFVYNSDIIPYGPQLESGSLSYTFTLSSSLTRPTFLLRTPLLGEILGAGFTKTYKSRYYALRFPRLNKIYRPAERSWEEAITLDDLYEIASRAVGRVSSTTLTNNITSEIWGETVHLGVRSTVKRGAARSAWETGPKAMDDRRLTVKGPYRPLSRLPVEVPEPIADSTKRRRLVTYKANSTSSSTNAVPASGQGVVPSLKPRLPPLPASGGYFACVKIPSLRAGSVDPSLKEEASKLATHPGSLIWSPQSGGKMLIMIERIIESAIPQEQQVHSLESLMAGCGWYIDRLGSPWVQRGVIFLDENPTTGKAVARSILRSLEEQLSHVPVGHPRKKIWIFGYGKEETEYQDWAMTVSWKPRAKGTWWQAAFAGSRKHFVYKLV